MSVCIIISMQSNFSLGIDLHRDRKYVYTVKNLVLKDIWMAWENIKDSCFLKGFHIPADRPSAKSDISSELRVWQCMTFRKKDSATSSNGKHRCWRPEGPKSAQGICWKEQQNLQYWTKVVFCDAAWFWPKPAVWGSHGVSERESLPGVKMKD